MEIIHVSKQPTGYWRNQKGNKKISINKWQWKYDNLKPMGCSKSSFKREFHSNKILPQKKKKKEKHWIYNLTLYGKQLEKEDFLKSPKLL